MQLHLATDEEKRARDLLTFSEWGGGLKLSQWLEREICLRAHAFSRGMETWFWVKDSQVLASCETFENVSCIEDKVGRTASIASVFTEPHLRGQGHASAMLAALGHEYKRRQSAQAMVLFSDVGEELYQRVGFVSVGEANDWILSPRAGSATASVTCSELSVLPEWSAAQKETLRLFPTAEQLDWAVERERLYARFLHRRAPQWHSARSGTAAASWAAKFKSNELVVQWLETGTDADTEAVLNVARYEAHRCGLQQVRIWALPEMSKPHGAELNPREGEFPMFRSCVPNSIDAWTGIQRALWV